MGPRLCPGCRMLDGEHDFGPTCTCTPMPSEPKRPSALDPHTLEVLAERFERQSQRIYNQRDSTPVDDRALWHSRDGAAEKLTRVGARLLSEARRIRARRSSRR
jgi:hypothetical protein